MGGGGIVVLSNGNYVVRSYRWDNGSAEDAAASGGGASMNVTFREADRMFLVGRPLPPKVFYRLKAP